MNKYSIYIIHDKKKVGLAKDLDDRLGQQGYKKSDETVEIFIEGLTDLATARQIEKQLQEKLGYDAHEDGEDLVDIVLKGKKGWSGKHFKTYEGKTIGFPEESENILDLLGNGCKLETLKGTYDASADDVKALHTDGHFRKSKFPNGNLRTYIYTKIVDNYFEKNKKKEVKVQEDFVSLDSLVNAIFAWAHDRGILNGKIETQTLKLGEEFGELQKAVLKDQPEEIKDAIGDIIVVLVSIAHFNGHTVADAVKMAYDTISKRTGYTNDKGDFIKQYEDGKKIETL